jgi:hypothetical protein
LWQPPAADAAAKRVAPNWPARVTKTDDSALMRSSGDFRNQARPITRAPLKSRINRQLFLLLLLLALFRRLIYWLGSRVRWLGAQAGA